MKDVWTITPSGLGDSHVARRRGLLEKMLAGLRSVRGRRADRELAELVESRGGAMADRCQRKLRRDSCRTHPFRQIPALKPR